MEKVTEEEKIEHLKQIYADLDHNLISESIIRDNKNYFSFDDKSYRVSMPSPKDLAEAEQVKQKTYGKFLVTEGYYLEKKLREILKENQGVDIAEMEEKKASVTRRLHRAYLDLAALGGSKDKELIKAHDKKVQDIEIEFLEISADIGNYLHTSIEKQTEKLYINYLTFLCTETLSVAKDDSWESTWNAIEEFEHDKSKLPLICSNALNELLMDTKEVI